jgi:hypothetical protein
MRPRRLSGGIARPLSFTVRSQLGEIQRREEQGAPPFGAAVCELQLTGSSCRRLRSAHPSARAAICSAIELGARAERVALRRRWDWAPRPLRLRLGRAYVGEYVAFACR